MLKLFFYKIIIDNFEIKVVKVIIIIKNFVVRLLIINIKKKQDNQFFVLNYKIICVVVLVDVIGGVCGLIDDKRRKNV